MSTLQKERTSVAASPWAREELEKIREDLGKRNLQDTLDIVLKVYGKAKSK